MRILIAVVSNQDQHPNLMLKLWFSLESEYHQRIQGLEVFQTFSLG